jgi:hypothetical protein
MKVNKDFLRLLVSVVFFAVVSTPCWADVYFGGFEDTPRASGDNDYNDFVFQISGVTLNSTASWFSKTGSTLNDSGVPFWNNNSSDGSAAQHGIYNVGYCIYGGGACGPGYDPSAQYLAASNTTTGSANDVTFSAAGGVGGQALLQITAGTDVLGWALAATPGTIHFLNPGGTIGEFSFAPGGTFVLVGNNNNGSGGNTYYSYTADGNGGDTSGVSHFAFFGNPVPEPTSIILLGTVVALAACHLRRRYSQSV